MSSLLGGDPRRDCKAVESEAGWGSQPVIKGVVVTVASAVGVRVETRPQRGVIPRWAQPLVEGVNSLALLAHGVEGGFGPQGEPVGHGKPAECTTPGEA